MPITSKSLRALVAEIPEPRLREMFIELVLGNTAVTNPTPAEPQVRRSRGRPKGQPNKDRANGGTTAMIIESWPPGASDTKRTGAPNERRLASSHRPAFLSHGEARSPMPTAQSPQRQIWLVTRKVCDLNNCRRAADERSDAS